jgi:hypothetical protein
VPDGYQDVSEQKDFKGKVQIKDNCVRIEMTVNLSSNRLFQSAASLENYETWLNSDSIKCLSNKQSDTHKSSSEIYCMTLLTQNLGKVDFLYRKFVQN